MTKKIVPTEMYIEEAWRHQALVELLCIREAMEGGKSLLVGTATLYNDMQRQRPDLAALMFEPVATDRRGEVPNGQKPYFEIPVLNWHAGFLTGIYQRRYVDSAQRFPDAPRLAPAQIEALDLFASNRLMHRLGLG